MNKATTTKRRDEVRYCAGCRLWLRVKRKAQLTMQPFVCDDCANAGYNAELALECASYSIRQCALLILREATEMGIEYGAQACGNGKPVMALDCDSDLRVVQARLDGYSAIVVSTPNSKLAQFINELSSWVDGGVSSPR